MSWVDFRSFWEVLGGLLGGLGASLGVLEGSWAALGPSWVVRVVLSSTGSAAARHLCRFWSPKGSQDEAKFDPRGTKFDVENQVEKRRLLKIVLEPS